MRDHQSWRTTFSSSRSLQFNQIEPTTQDHMSWETTFLWPMGQSFKTSFTVLAADCVSKSELLIWFLISQSLSLPLCQPYSERSIPEVGSLSRIVRPQTRRRVDWCRKAEMMAATAPPSSVGDAGPPVQSVLAGRRSACSLPAIQHEGTSITVNNVNHSNDGR